MKNVGIITFHRLNNLGSVLQAYALNAYLRQEGHKVETIDYVYKPHIDKYRLFEPVKSLKSLLRNAQSLIYLHKLLLQKRKFKIFRDQYIPMSNAYLHKNDLTAISNKYDCIICGSDQIWNQNSSDYDDAYMLSFVEDKSRCMAYAPSIGSSFVTEDQIVNYKKYLEGFRLIAVREQKTAEIFEGFLGRRPELVLDPVFLIEQSQWESLCSPVTINKPYILCYFIGDVSGMRKFAQVMRSKTNFELVVVRMNLRDLFMPTKKLYDTGPMEFLNLVKNAEYVCTNSFHAMAFSIIFMKKFWIFTEPDKNAGSQERIFNISDLLGLQSRVVNISSKDVDIEEPINYSIVNEKLEVLKLRSKTILSLAMEDMSNGNM